MFPTYISTWKNTINNDVKGVAIIEGLTNHTFSYIHPFIYEFLAQIGYDPAFIAYYHFFVLK